MKKFYIYAAAAVVAGTALGVAYGKNSEKCNEKAKAAADFVKNQFNKATSVIKKTCAHSTTVAEETAEEVLG